jgi:hypothetical protein
MFQYCYMDIILYSQNHTTPRRDVDVEIRHLEYDGHIVIDIIKSLLLIIFCLFLSTLSVTTTTVTTV